MRMKELLEKYRCGRITPEEMETLGREVEAASDNEIGNILESEWIREGIRDGVSGGMPKGASCGADSKENGKGHDGTPKVRRLRLWTGAAAGLLLMLSAGLTVRLIGVSHEQGRIASREMRINAGDDDKSRIVLPDGTKVILNAKSTIEYPADFGMRDRRVRLSGQGYFDVAKDPERKFVVSAQGMDITVHGTKFNVYAYPDNDLREVSLVEGSISLRYGDSEMMLAPNEKVCIRAGSGRLNMLRTDNSVETCWLEDRITFINKPLYQVIDVLQRHFGVTIECSSSINLADRYTGSFSEHRVEDILDILKMHYGFSYESRDNHIIIK